MDTSGSTEFSEVTNMTDDYKTLKISPFMFEMDISFLKMLNTPLKKIRLFLKSLRQGIPETHKKKSQGAPENPELRLRS